MNEVLRVTTWRDPPKYRGLTTLTHIDGTGISLKVRQRCDYCGQWTIRYDTVEHKPLHQKCEAVGRYYWSNSPDQEQTIRIHENRYVDAKFLEERDHEQ